MTVHVQQGMQHHAQAQLMDVLAGNRWQVKGDVSHATFHKLIAIYVTICMMQYIYDACCTYMHVAVDDDF